VSVGILVVSGTVAVVVSTGAASVAAGATSSVAAGSSAGVSPEPHPIAITVTRARGSAQPKPLNRRKVFCIEIILFYGVKSKVLFLKI
jgi:hypothetical protein